MSFISWKDNQESYIKIWKVKYNKIKKSKNKLNFEQYLKKAYKAGILHPDKISCKGNSKTNYQLCRYKDRGEYSVTNCYFDTQFENMKQRNEHFDVSFSNKKRVKNRTHNLLGGKQQSKVQIELVKKGKHNFKNLPPWKNSKSTSNSLEVWYKAEECYEWWLNYQGSYRKLKLYFNFKSDSACFNLIKKFKEKWTPSEDEIWLEWRNTYE